MTAFLLTALLIFVNMKLSASDSVQIMPMENQFRLNQLWDWFLQQNNSQVSQGLDDLERRISHLERFHEERNREDEYQGNSVESLSAGSTSSSTTQSSTAQTSSEPTRTYQPEYQPVNELSPVIGEFIHQSEEENDKPKLYNSDKIIDCGGKGFYQVGNHCYSFTFYRSLNFHDAAEFCKVSGGYLAVLETKEEMEALQEYLVDHVASNIYPWDIVSFTVGARSTDGTVKWIGGNQVSSDIEKCEQGYGECTALSWNQAADCRFTLLKIDCRQPSRFMCERDPIL